MSRLNRLWNPTTQKWLRRGRRTLWCVLLLAFIWYAVVRWTTPPAAYSHGLAASTKHSDDSLDELVTLLESLPRFPGGGQGNWYELPLEDVSHGEWTHDRTLIKDAVSYLTAPATASNVLDQLDAFLAVHRVDGASPAPEIGNDVLRSRVYRTDPMLWGRAVTALTARARYRAMERHNLAGALADLRAASRLAAFGDAHSNRLLSYYYAYNQSADIPGIPLLEWACTAQEHPLPPALVAETIAFLRDELSLSAVVVVQRVTGISQDSTTFLDRYYTSDGDGNGWLVLSYAAPAISEVFGSFRDDTGKPRSGFWNLFSPLFNDRATVRAKVQRWHDAVSRLNETEAFMLHPMLERAGLSEQAYDSPSEVLDGPVSRLRHRLHPASCTQLHAEVAVRRALVVMLALAAYRHDHATYPETLDALVPDYLDAVPIDLHAQAPFVYERLADDRYHLAPAGQSPMPWSQLLTGHGVLVEEYSIPRPAVSE